jgi:hypothetical protein
MEQHLSRGTILMVLGALLAGFGLGRLTASGPMTARSLMRQMDAGPVDCVATRTPLSQPLYAFDWGSCRVQSDDIQVVTFRTTTGRERYDRVAEDFGRWVLRGNTWRITGNSASNAQAIQSELGGALDQ